MFLTVLRQKNQYVLHSLQCPLDRLVTNTKKREGREETSGSEMKAEIPRVTMSPTQAESGAEWSERGTVLSQPSEYGLEVSHFTTRGYWDVFRGDI